VRQRERQRGDDNAGAQLFFQGQAAMHPIGSWLVSWAIDEAPDLEFDFVNLPAMPEGSAGDQASAMGVETGYMVNANSPNIDLAIEFWRSQPENAASTSRQVVRLPVGRRPGWTAPGPRGWPPHRWWSCPDTGYDPGRQRAHAAEAAVWRRRPRRCLGTGRTPGPRTSREVGCLASAPPCRLPAPSAVKADRP
jgi:hypothetical protein